MIDRETARFIRAALPQRLGRLSLLVTLSVVAAVAEGSGLFLLALIINRLTDGATLSGARLDTAMAGYLAVAAAAAAVVYARTIYTARLRFDVVDALRRRAFEAILNAEWPALRRLPAPATTHAITVEAARAGAGIDFLVRAIEVAVRLPVLVVVAARLSLPLTAAVLALGTLVAAVASRADRRARETGEEILRGGREVQRAVSDALASRRVVKVFGLERERQRAFEAVLATSQRAQLLHQRQTAGSGTVLMFAVPASAAAALWLGTRVMGLEIGTALVAALTFARIGQSAFTLRNARRQVLASLPADAAVRQLIEDARTAAEPDAAHIDPPRARISLDSVSLHYHDGTAALSDVSVEIPVGGITAILGPSGAGKSTLLDLLLGLTAPTHGRVSLDDRALDERTRRAWRAHTGYVPQDNFLFDASIRDNLAAARPSALEAELWQALDDAAIGDRVRGLTHGLDTPAFDGTARLSVGEMQRLALARALLRRPALLALDEPTSALDDVSEARLLETLSRLRGRHTIVIVAHRASVRSIADHAIVLDGGRITGAAPVV